MNQADINQNLIHANIVIHIEAFGAIERQIAQDLSFEFDSEIQITQVLERIEQAYPSAVAMLDQCACAVGEDILPRQTVLKSDSTLVLLSPVAGG